MLITMACLLLSRVRGVLAVAPAVASMAATTDSISGSAGATGLGRDVGDPPLETNLPPNVPSPPGLYNPERPSMPWWVPTNPNDDWKYNTVTVVGGSVAIAASIAVAAPAAITSIATTAIEFVIAPTLPVLVH